ncbi:MAG: hypothetical protein EXS41_01705 [Opitutaceae bacterium]|nr:hypothetical protein [Opitutaceae bacterium]
MSPFQFEPKLSGAASSSLAGLPAGAFASEAGAKAARTSAKLKRSFASMLGQVKKEAPSASSTAPGVKSPQGSETHRQAQQALEVVKAKSLHSTRPTASETRAQSTRDPAGRVDDSGEQELPADLPADEQEGSTEVFPDADNLVGLVPVRVPQPLLIQESAPVNLCAFETQFESASVEAEAMALTITAEANSTAGDDRARASVEAMPAIVNQIGGREAALPAAFAAAQTPATQRPAAQTSALQTPATQAPATQTPATQTPATQTRQAEGVWLNFNDAAEGKAVNADGERSTQQDAAGAFKLPAGLNAVAAQTARALIAASLPRSLKAEKSAALSSAVSAIGDESMVSTIFNSVENNINQLFKKVDAVVGPSIANNNSNMSSPLLDFSAASPSDVPAAEAVTRVNLVQVVNELAAITEKVRISGQQRCVVDLDVTGHGKLRVEVVRRADQVETVLSTDSASLRESLQAAFDRSDRSSHFSSSFQWQGSPDTSGRGQNGAQADADARQNMYFKAEPAARVGRTPSLPVVPVAPVAAPVLAANHRLQIFA